MVETKPIDDEFVEHIPLSDHTSLLTDEGRVIIMDGLFYVALDHKEAEMLRRVLNRLARRKK